MLLVRQIKLHMQSKGIRLDLVEIGLHRLVLI